MAITKRRGLIVYFTSRRVVRAVRKIARVVYVSKHQHYLVVYVNENELAAKKKALADLRAVKKVVESYLPEVDPDVVDLEQTGLYKSHDEDD